jgi:hypothetical protein
MKIYTSSDGYILSKVMPGEKLKEKVDWERHNITEDEVREHHRNHDPKTCRIPLGATASEKWYLIHMQNPYFMLKEGDEVYYYDDIGVLSGSTGYVWFRDGYVVGSQIVRRS